MLRKLVAAMAVAGAVGTTAMPGIAYGLGLGEIQLNSSLNQPLNARIDLVEVRELSEIEILPNLATRADFERAEVARPYFLSTLKFKTISDEKGRLYIQVSSDKPVIEPFLNFLVEVHWPNGRLLREYTLLLDPPSFSSEVFDAARSELQPDPVEQIPDELIDVVDELPVEAVPELAVDLEIDAREELAIEADQVEYDGLVEPEQRPAVSGHSESEEATDKTITLSDYLKESEMEKRPDAVAPISMQDIPVLTNASLNEAGTGGSYAVKKGDTLYEVAMQTRPGRDVSVNRMMMALQGRNPDAFINGNVNLLRAGKTLQIPDRETIDTIGSSTANQFIARQNREWRDNRAVISRKVQLDATRKTVVEPVQRGTVEDDHLNIVSVGAEEESAGGADQGKGTAESGQARELESRMAIKQEQLATLSRENAELNDRLRDLEEQIESLEKLVLLKSNQLASLQSMEELELEQDELPVDESAPVSEVSDVIDESVDYNYSDGAQAQAEPLPPETVIAGIAGEQAETDAGDVPSGLFGDPIKLAGIGGGIALLVAGAALIIRRRRQQHELEDEDIIPDILKDYDETEEQGLEALETDRETGEDSAGSELSEPGSENVTDDAELEQLTGVADRDSEPVAGQEPEPEPEPEMQVEPAPPAEETAEETDVLGEVDIYIAYGRFPQAAELLKEAIAGSPERTDFRIKFMEVLVEMQDAEEFQVQEKAIQAGADAQAISRAAELRQRFPASAFQTPVEDESADLQIDEGTAQAEVMDSTPEVPDQEVENASVAGERESAAGSDSEAADSIEGLEFDLNDLEVADQVNDAEETAELESSEPKAGQEPEKQEETLPELEDLELDASFGLESSEVESTGHDKAEETQDAEDDGAAVDLSADFDSELAELDDELANLSSDMNLDVEDLESALDADDQAFVAELSESAPAEKPLKDEESKPAAINLDALTADLDTGSLDQDATEGDFSFLEESDEASTKLDLARAYMEMGDADGARDILAEVLNEGSEAQKKEAQTLIDQLGS